jgi:integrase
VTNRIAFDDLGLVDDRKRDSRGGEKVKWVWRPQISMSVAFCSGLRRHLILNLTWADIDFENRWIHIQAKKGSEDLMGWESKDHENRVVPMFEDTGLLLARMQSASQLLNSILAEVQQH